MRPINKIYIHCSYSLWGTFDEIDRWHKERSFTEVDCPIRKRPIYIGYHFLILNPFQSSKSVKDELFRSFTDGQVVTARPVSSMGCHIKGDNEHSIGICYVGVSPTVMQFHSLLLLCKKLMKEHSLTVDDIFGHYEYYILKKLDPLKTCPNFNMESFRGALRSLF